MCSIVGSFDENELKELCNANEYRGTHSYSISLFKENKIMHCEKDLGKLDYTKIKIPPGQYCVVHQQAPTSENRNIDNVHPAILTDKWGSSCFLWHNGILKDKAIKLIQERFQMKTSWDSLLLLKEIMEDGTGLNFIDGSFACLYFNGKDLFVFRNLLAPMYINKNTGTISSTYFENSEALEDGQFYVFNPFQHTMKSIFTFKTYNNPYNF